LHSCANQRNHGQHGQDGSGGKSLPAPAPAVDEGGNNDGDGGYGKHEGQ
jgi:hypothetical protein